MLTFAVPMESTPECGDLEDRVESAGGGAVESDADVCEENSAVIRFERKSDSAGKGQVKQGQTAGQLAIHGYQTGDDRSCSRIEDEAVEFDLRPPGSEREPTRVRDLAGRRVQIDRTAGYWEVDGSAVKLQMRVAEIDAGFISGKQPSRTPAQLGCFFPA